MGAENGFPAAAHNGYRFSQHDTGNIPGSGMGRAIDGGNGSLTCTEQKNRA